MRDQRWKTSKRRSLQKLEISFRRNNDRIRRFSTIMEYYTKIEGLGFLIRKSRIDFRIEFRGVSILCEFNPSTKTRYGHTRTHQRPLVFHDHLVSHDHHQTTLWPHSNPSTSIPLIQRFQSLCHVTQMTTRRSYRDSGTSDGDDSIQMSSFLGFPFQVTG